MPFVAREQSKCPKCSKSVYTAEERVAAGEKWHNGCFKCNLCNKRLDSVNVADHAYPDGRKELYCRGCYGRKFGPKGVGFGIGAGALGMDTGAHLGNADGCLMTNRPSQPEHM